MYISVAAPDGSSGSPLNVPSGLLGVAAIDDLHLHLLQRARIEDAAHQIVHAVDGGHKAAQRGDALRGGLSRLTNPVDRGAKDEAKATGSVLHQLDRRGRDDPAGFGRAAQQIELGWIGARIEAERILVASHRLDKFDHVVGGTLAGRAHRELGLSARIDAVVRAHFRDKRIEPFWPDLAQRLQRLEAGVASRKIEHVDIASELGAIDPTDRGVQPLHADQHFGMGAQAIADGGRNVGSIRAEAALHVGCDHPFRQHARRKCRCQTGNQDHACGDNRPSSFADASTPRNTVISQNP